MNFRLFFCVLLGALPLLTACSEPQPVIHTNLPEKTPIPAVGRWKAVYTANFAEKYHLPADNISTNLSPGVDYMEMQVLNFGPKKATGCFVNMLVKQPNDISLVHDKEAYPFNEFNKERELTKFASQPNPLDLKRLSNISFASTDYSRKNLKGPGFSFSTLGFYSPNYLAGYDYITTNAQCVYTSWYKEAFLNKFAIMYMKSEVWGKFERTFTNLDDPKRPQGEDYRKSFGYISIPPEIITSVYEGIN